MPSTLTVTLAPTGARLDKALAAALPGLSRARLQGLILEGCVTAGGTALTDPSRKVKAELAVRVAIPPCAPALPRPQAMTLTVVHEDADLIVLDKPAGLVVHPGAGNPDATLVNALLAHCGASLSGIGGIERPGIVHRLDKDTTGLIVVAKNDRAHRSLARQFEGRAITRAYLALVKGAPGEAEGRIETRLGRSPADRQKMAVLREGGRSAGTLFRVLRRFGRAVPAVAALVECRLLTGRTHQIRVHMAHLGHGLIGDAVYGGRAPGSWTGLPPAIRAELEGFARQALHARSLGFQHPTTQEHLLFEAEPPHDFKALQALLEGL